MKREQCTMGTRVAHINEYHTEQISFGYIAGEISEQEGYSGRDKPLETVVIVQWEERYTSQAWDGTDGPDHIRKVHVDQTPIDELISEEEGLKAQALLKEKEASLEARFELVKGDVIAKVERAAELIREANFLIPDAGRDGKMLCKMREECKPLLSAMAEGGWHVSANYR